MRRVLLDESLPRPLREVLTGFEITTVQEAGWASMKNGELLRLAEDRFDVFLTGDKGIQFQQNVGTFGIGIVVAAGRTTKLEDLLPLIPEIRDAIEAVRAGQLIEVQAE